MTREQLKAILPEGADDTAVTKILDALHTEIQPYKDAAKKAQDDLAAKVAEMAEISKKAATAEEKTKAYDELQAKYDKDVKTARERAEALEFDSALNDKLKEKGAKNVKAARALLDMDALKASKNRDADMDAAIEALAKDEGSAFLFGAEQVGRTSVGAGTGKSGAPMTKEEIRKIKDPAERQAAIAANLKLYQNNR